MGVDVYRVVIDTTLIPFPKNAVVDAVVFRREVEGGTEPAVMLTGPSWCGPEIQYILPERHFMRLLVGPDGGPRDAILSPIGDTASTSRYVAMVAGGVRVRGGGALEVN